MGQLGGERFGLGELAGVLDEQGWKLNCLVTVTYKLYKFDLKIIHK